MPGPPAPTESMRPAVFAILLALHEDELHGYGIMKAVNERVGRRALLGPGTLYRTLKELRDGGLIAYTDGPADTDPRRQYYRITQEGRRAARREAARMEDWVDAAREARVLTDPGSGR